MAGPPAHYSNDNVVKFYTAWGSRFAERVWIALDKKGVRYEVVEVDLKDKPEEMLRSNPRGKVPALVHKGHTICESAVIIEYLEEAFPSPSYPALFPRELHLKAKGREWIQFITVNIGPAFFRIARDVAENESAKAHKELRAHLRTFNEALGEASSHGPFFFGNQLSAVDIHLAPFALRLPQLERDRAFRPPPESDIPRLYKWMRAVERDPHVLRTIPSEESLLRHYLKICHV